MLSINYILRITIIKYVAMSEQLFFSNQLTKSYFMTYYITILSFKSKSLLQFVYFRITPTPPPSLNQQLSQRSFHKFFPIYFVIAFNFLKAPLKHLAWLSK